MEKRAVNFEETGTRLVRCTVLYLSLGGSPSQQRLRCRQAGPKSKVQQLRAPYTICPPNDSQVDA
jgi:hypothetical protein